jgi:ribose transport system ATP-binding protein
MTIYQRLSRFLLIDHAREAQAAERQVNRLRIVTTSRAQQVARLSGGNQQKVVVGKWLSHGAELFIFDEPTTGVDVGTKADIYRLFGELVRRGAGIILISSHLPEVDELADTLHVFRRGQLAASYKQKQATHEEILMQALGT